MSLQKRQIRHGLEWSKVTGAVGCMGRYNGRQLVGVNGNLLLEEADLLGQPFHAVQATFQVKDTSPDVLTVENLRAPIFGGDISGQIASISTRPSATNSI